MYIAPSHMFPLFSSSTSAFTPSPPSPVELRDVSLSTPFPVCALSEAIRLTDGGETGLVRLRLLRRLRHLPCPLRADPILLRPSVSGGDEGGERDDSNHPREDARLRVRRREREGNGELNGAIIDGDHMRTSKVTISTWKSRSLHRLRIPIHPKAGTGWIPNK